jgi:hypothetical protein
LRYLPAHEPRLSAAAPKGSPRDYEPDVFSAVSRCIREYKSAKWLIWARAGAACSLLPVRAKPHLRNITDSGQPPPLSTGPDTASSAWCSASISL